jgi:hypothetical protein
VRWPGVPKRSPKKRRNRGSSAKGMRLLGDRLAVWIFTTPGAAWRRRRHRTRGLPCAVRGRSRCPGAPPPRGGSPDEVGEEHHHDGSGNHTHHHHLEEESRYLGHEFTIAWAMPGGCAFAPRRASNAVPLVRTPGGGGRSRHEPDTGRPVPAASASIEARRRARAALSGFPRPASLRESSYALSGLFGLNPQPVAEDPHDRHP